MKQRSLLATLALVGALFSGAFAQDAAPATPPAITEMQAAQMWCVKAVTFTA